MNITAVIVEFFSIEWMEITGYLIKNEEKTHLTGKHWVNDGIVPALLVFQLVCAKREEGALIFGCTYLVTSIVPGALLGMP